MGCRITRKISELGNVVGGATPSTKNPAYWDGNIPWLSPKDLTRYHSRFIGHGARNITQDGLDSSSTTMLPTGTVLFSSRAPIGYVAIAANPICTNQGFKSVVPNDQTDSLFLYYLLKANKNKIEGLASGTTFKEVSATTMRSLEVKVPASLGEQRAIASVLGALDAKIESNTKINGYLLEMAKVIYRQWFVGDTAKYPTTTMKLSDIATINAGGDKPKDVSQTIQPGFCVPIYSNGTDNEGLYGFTSVAKINEPSVTVSARGTIGFTCLRRRPYYPIVRLISATPKRCVTAEYLYLWLLNMSVVGVGTTQQQLTVPMFKAYDIKVPEAKAMEQFSQTINPLFDAIDSNKEECIKLAALRDVLLPRLMSGEIDVQKVAIGCGLLH